MRQELVDRADEWNLFQEAAIAVAWGPDAMAARALAEADDEGFAELSMVIGLLGWLAWDVETDIPVASRRSEFEESEEDQWYAVQLLAVLGPWLVEDSSAQVILQESVARTPRFRIDGERWLHRHLDALGILQMVVASAEEFGEPGRAVESGNLVVLRDGETPRVRVVLNVVGGGTDGKISVFDPNEKDGIRYFMASRVMTLPWIDLARQSRRMHA